MKLFVVEEAIICDHAVLAFKGEILKYHHYDGDEFYVFLVHKGMSEEMEICLQPKEAGQKLRYLGDEEI